MDVETSLRVLVEEQLQLSRRLRARIRELEDQRSTPVALVAVAMRLPGGVADPESYWKLLNGHGHAVSGIPADRPGLRAVTGPEIGTPGRSYVTRAGFLDDVGLFDADFFGMSVREAEALDPQQRLLLETAWEAAERAGIPIDRQRGLLEAGVFVGLMSSEYTDRIARGPTALIDPYFGTGGGHCFAAGRISHTFGFRGPALTLDTACSSSLVALHQATRSLRALECRYAFVGGANLLFSPELMVALCQSRALAPDGRSKPFLASADGYGRGEGVAMALLMRLDDAVTERRPILAVIRGSAVNHDGAASGLTVPSGPAQEEVIRAALRDARHEPGDVSFVETHGTGTNLGDPIEARALEAVFGASRSPQNPLIMGAVKSRVGHLEAAAGMAGVIKVALMLQHGVIPADIDDADGRLNPLIPWSTNHLEVPRRAHPWTKRERVAGVSAFGLSGTNAHVILEEHPAQDNIVEHVPSGPELLVLSARSIPALRALHNAVVNLLEESTDADLAGICHTLRTGRTPMPVRVAVTASTASSMVQRLRCAVDALPVGGPPRRSGAEEVVRLLVGPTKELAESLRTLLCELPGLAAVVPVEDDPVVLLTSVLGAVGIHPTSTAPSTGCPAALETAEGSSIEVLPTESAAVAATFPAALGHLFTSGAQVNLEPLSRPGMRHRSDLPTYPFRRRRYWIDEPATAAITLDDTAPTGHAVPSTPGPVPMDRAADHEELTRSFLRGELAAVLRAEDEPDLTRSFAELGGDSFTAMLYLRSIEATYGLTKIGEEFEVDVPVGELIDRLTGLVTAHIDGQPSPH
jgi:acyl transferase domain-containing protein